MKLPCTHRRPEERARARRRRRARQNGMALAMALLFTAVLAVLVGMILFSSQYETLSAANYAAQQRAFYAADAGIQSALNWFENDYYTLYNTNTALYTATTTPVELASNGEAVVLDATGGSSNYPNTAVPSSFASTFGSGSGVSLGSGEQYTVKAELTVLHSVTSTGGTGTVERWKITSNGSWVEGSTTLAQVTLDAYVEPATTPMMNEAIFTTSETCGSTTISGSVSTDSYNSSEGPYSTTHSNTEGNIGSNGGITASGSVTVNGTITVPGGSAENDKCTSTSPGGVTYSGSASYQSEAALSAQQTYPSPTMPSPWNLSSYPPNNGTAIGSTLSPGNYGNISLSGSNSYTLSAGTYNINSLTYSGSVTLTMSGAVVINLVGSGTTAPLTGSGSATLNVNKDDVASDLTVNYAGTGTISLSGSDIGAMVLYAPNAAIDFSGSSNFYGTVVSKTAAFSGSVALHYDMALFNSLQQLSNYQLVGWSRTVN